jgi:hypothetical protein
MSGSGRSYRFRKRTAYAEKRPTAVVRRAAMRTLNDRAQPSPARSEATRQGVTVATCWASYLALQTTCGFPLALLVRDVVPRIPIDAAAWKGHSLERPFLGEPLSNCGVQPRFKSAREFALPCP